MSQDNYNVTCPYCNNHFYIRPSESEVNGEIDPIGNIRVYRITSDMIRSFLIKKAEETHPGTKIELATRYCEKKKRKKSDPSASWASLRIAFSEGALVSNNNESWFDRIGDDGSVRFVESIFKKFIERYQYDKKSIDMILDNYRDLEELEERQGITEQFIEDIRKYCTPRRVLVAGTEPWIFFAARPEKVIEDMLSDPQDDKVDGRMTIESIRQISKDSIEFLVHVSEKEMRTQENPYVRQLLSGKGSL